MFGFNSIDEAVRFFLSIIDDSTVSSDEDIFMEFLDTLRPRNFYYAGMSEAVLYNGRVVLFWGDGGSGKTTMVKHFSDYARGVPLSEDGTWMYIPRNSSPHVINMQSSEVINAPLEWVVHLVKNEDKSGARRVSSKKTIKWLFELYTTPIRKGLREEFRNIKFLEYNSVHERGNPLATYQNIRGFIEGH